MKKTYITPIIVAVGLDASDLMAISLAIDNEKNVDTSMDGVQLGRENDRSDSIWEQTW